MTLTSSRVLLSVLQGLCQGIDSLSMEETWMTMHWPNCVLCFLLVVTMVNVQNAANYFAKTPKLDSLLARCLIAKQLMQQQTFAQWNNAKKASKTRYG